MDYINKIKLGEEAYTLQSGGVADPDDASIFVDASDIKESVDFSDKMSTENIITFISSNWSKSEDFYYNTVTFATSTQNSKPIISGLVYPTNCSDNTRKEIQKSIGYIIALETLDGAIRLQATRRPSQSITIALRGI